MRNNAIMHDIPACIYGRKKHSACHQRRRDGAVAAHPRRSVTSDVSRWNKHLRSGDPRHAQRNEISLVPRLLRGCLRLLSGSGVLRDAPSHLASVLSVSSALCGTDCRRFTKNAWIVRGKNWIYISLNCRKCSVYRWDATKIIRWRSTLCIERSFTERRSVVAPMYEIEKLWKIFFQRYRESARLWPTSISRWIPYSSIWIASSSNATIRCSDSLYYGHYTRARNFRPPRYWCSLKTSITSLSLFYQQRWEANRLY